MKENTDTISNPTEFYNQQLERLQLQLAQLKKKANYWIIIRLLCFSLIPTVAYFSWNLGVIFAVLVFLSFLLFLFTVKKSTENKERLEFVKNLIWINESELKALLGDYAAFGDGTKFKNPTHAFSYDFDVFGKQQLFPFINRTVSNNGEERLANMLLNGVENETAVNEALEELLQHVPWSQAFRAKGIKAQKEAKKEGRKTNLSELKNIVSPYRSGLNAFVFIIPVISIAATIAYNFDWISGFQFAIVFFLAMAPALRLLKKSNVLHQRIAAHSFRTKVVLEQMKSMEEVVFSSAQLADFQEKLFNASTNAKKAFQELDNLQKQFDYRDNVLVAIALNFFLAWDIRMMKNWHLWHNKFQSYIGDWEDCLFEVESLISGMNFRFNKKNDTQYACLTNASDGEIQLLGLGHPLIPSTKLVKNDYTMTNLEQFAIVTGPNMAGKSTFLRSVGVNLMLAKAGFPVVAEKFTFPKLNLYSSMRTSDDLNSESSYFHAELVRLRFIVDAIERKEPVFIILDEILKGTNSKDKEQGSAAFLMKLISLGARGIIATHDLKLTELADNHHALINFYFDTTIAGDEISFDYTIRKGVAKNMNASFLLKKMGLT